MPTKYLMTLAPNDPRFDTDKTGDIDYAQTICLGLQESPDMDDFDVQLLRGYKTGDELYEELVANGPDSHVHLFINTPNIGTALTPAHLEQLKKFITGKLIVTVVEFYKHGRTHDGDILKAEILLRAQFADDLIFLDEVDKQAAINFIENNTDFENKLSISKKEFLKKPHKSSVINVPATVNIELKPLEERGDDILTFGIIRQGKGFAYILELARQFKEHGVSRKVHVVGSVQQELPVNAKGGELKRLISTVYPQLEADIAAAIKAQTIKTEGDLLQWFKNIAATQQLGEQALPIELHFDVPEAELSNIFNQCKYAWYSAYRGATLRNSSLSTLLNNDFIVISHAGEITPASLTARYLDAIQLYPPTLANPKHRINFNEYVNWAYELVTADSLATENVLRAIQLLKQECLAHEEIIAAHVKLITNDRKIKNWAFTHWRAKAAKSKTAKFIHDKSKMDITADLLQTNFKQLIKETRPLTAQEKQFLELMCSHPWTIQHGTNKSGEVIKKSQHILSTNRLEQILPADQRQSRTPTELGQTGLVFFSIYPNAAPTIPLWIDSDDADIFTIDLDLSLQHEAIFREGYISGHWYSYQISQKNSPIFIGKTTILTTYKFNSENFLESTKTITFLDKTTGLKKVLTLHPNDELYSLSAAKEALSLMFIKIMRNCDAETYAKFFNAEFLTADNFPAICSMFTKVFHAGVLETQVPGYVRLNDVYTKDFKLLKDSLTKPVRDEITRIANTLKGRLYSEDWLKNAKTSTVKVGYDLDGWGQICIILETTPDHNAPRYLLSPALCAAILDDVDSLQEIYSKPLILHHFSCLHLSSDKVYIVSPWFIRFVKENARSAAYVSDLFELAALKYDVAAAAKLEDFFDQLEQQPILSDVIAFIDFAPNISDADIINILEKHQLLMVPLDQGFKIPIITQKYFVSALLIKLMLNNRPELFAYCFDKITEKQQIVDVMLWSPGFPKKVEEPYRTFLINFASKSFKFMVRSAPNN